MEEGILTYDAESLKSVVIENWSYLPAGNYVINIATEA